MATKTATAKIKLQYHRSKICTPVKHKLVIKGLGFTRLNQIVEREDTPSVRGHGGEGAAPGPRRRN
jgi:large subunit ribosomal protein L30